VLPSESARTKFILGQARLLLCQYYDPALGGKPAITRKRIKGIENEPARNS